MLDVVMSERLHASEQVAVDNGVAPHWVSGFLVRDLVTFYDAYNYSGFSSLVFAVNIPIVLAARQLSSSIL